MSLELINRLYADHSGTPFIDVPDYLSGIEHAGLEYLVGRDYQENLQRIRSDFGEDVYVAAIAALTAGHAVKGRTSPNPPVGACVLLGSASRTVAAVGATQPAGGPHAEVMALRAAGDKARGGTAVVTLEPCNHTGRTGPCSQALIDAGVARVIYLTGDPNPQATGGAEFLKDHGVEVHCAQITPAALEPWLVALAHERPAVTVKWAHTLDGFIAAQDRTSKWITGEVAREFVHYDRARRDAVIVGTGTALEDNPRLNARTPNGGEYAHQPLRVVVGTRSLHEDSFLTHAMVDPNEAQLGSGAVIQCPTVDGALSTLWRLGARDVVVEGGSTLFASLFEEGLVDFIDDYHAPAVLGAGVPLIGKVLAPTISQIKRFAPLHGISLGEDFLWRLKKK